MLAITEMSVTLMAVAAIGATGTLGAQIIGLFAAKRSRRTMHQAVDTGNEKPIGETVHDTAQAAELLVAQAHTNTKELMDLRGDVLGLHDKLDGHIEDTAPLVERAKAEWGDNGTRT